MGVLDSYDSAVGYSFKLKIDGVEIKAITEVSGLKLEADVVELKAQTAEGKYINQKMMGRPKSGEITVTRPLTDETKLEDWIKKVYDGALGESRKDGQIDILSYDGVKIKAYKFKRGFPKSLEIGSLKAGSTDVLTEKLTIAHEGLELAK